MKISHKPYFHCEEYVSGIFDPEAILINLERIGRICYKSENKITEDSYKSFIKKIIDNGHESVLEHEKITLFIKCDRAIANEIVRHRIGSYSQSSTRYCNYSRDFFNNQITVVDIPFKNIRSKKIWEELCKHCEKSYFELLKNGEPPELARGVLPLSLETEIYVTYNLRQWRHFLKLRTSKRAHPQMRQLTCEILKWFKNNLPIIFDDIGDNL